MAAEGAKTETAGGGRTDFLWFYDRQQFDEAALHLHQRVAGAKWVQRARGQREAERFETRDRGVEIAHAVNEMVDAALGLHGAWFLDLRCSVR